MPVASPGKFLFNDVADQENLAAAQEVGDDKCGQGGDKHHGDAADDPGDAQGQPDVEKGLDAVGSQVFCRIDGIVIDLHQNVVNRQHHKRQKVVYHTQDNSPGRIDDGDAGKPQGRQNAVDDAAFFQQGLPGQGSQQKVHPHWKDENKHDKAAGADAFLPQDHSQGVGQQKTDDRAGQGEGQGQKESLGVLRRGDGEHIFQGEGTGLVGEAVVDDQGQGDDGEADHPYNIGKCQIFGFRTIH